MQKHIRVVAMDNDLCGISGIEIGGSEIGLLQGVVYMQALPVHRIVARVDIVLDIRIGAAAAYGPLAGTDGDVPVGGRRGSRWC